MKKDKIIIIGTTWPFRGGLSAYNERLAQEFQTMGHEVIMITFTLQYPSFLFPGKTQMADWDAPEGLDIRQEISSINPLNWLKVGRKIKKEQADLVIIKYWLPFMGPCFGTIARIVKRNRKSKVITILDNIIPHEKRPGDTLFTRYFIKPVDAFIAMSQSVLDDSRKFDQKKPRSFCPHPLFDNFGEKIKKAEAKKYLGLEPDTRYALFFGFIREYKGLDLALEAFSEEKVRKHKVKLLVAGEFYDEEEKYRSLIKNLGIEEEVNIRSDFISDDQVKYYFSATDLVIQPYKTATQSGISQIAYHFNKPMIVTNVGGLPEIVPHEKAGFVVEKNGKEIAAAINRFYTEELEETLTRGAAEEKEKYSWNRMYNTIVELKEKL